MAHRSRGCSAAVSLALGVAVCGFPHLAAAAAPTWLLQQEVIPLGDNTFGSAVLAGDTLLVGDSGGGEDVGGLAYVYERAGSTWSLKQTIEPDDLAFNDNFGGNLALAGDTAVISATQQAGGGALYVYARSAGSWALQQKLPLPDPTEFARFGYCPQISGNTIAAAGDDAVYVFTRSGSTWTLQKKLTPADKALLRCGALDGDTLVAGSPLHTDAPTIKAGAAYVFVRNGGVWSEQQKLTASDAVSFDAWGTDVAVQGDTLLMSDWPNVVRHGATYVFTRSGTTWTQGPKLMASDGSEVDGFGALAFQGNTALIGASMGHSGDGAAYFFTRSGNTWTETQRLDKPGILGAFGAWTSLSGNYAMAVSGDGIWIYRFGKVAGDACGSTDACGGSGVCSAEGVCCDAACNGGCESCLASRKGSGADGVCGVVAVDTDPLEHCATEAATSCGMTGVCDGLGSCSLFAPATECDPASCPTPTSENPHDECDGAGACVATTVADCEIGYLCVDGACKTACESDADCNGGEAFVCGSGICKVPSAEPCNVDGDCDSGHCADGLCCDKACDGQCEACAEPKHEGICVAVSGEPRALREACDAVGDAACAARCDGTKRAKCQYVPATTSCGCASPEAQQLCDGQGFCAVSSPQSCGGFACRDDACLTECQSDRDCNAGFGCLAGECELLRDDSPPSEDSASAPSSAVDDAGCGCRSAGGPASNQAGGLLLALLAAASLGRRERAKKGVSV